MGGSVLLRQKQIHILPRVTACILYIMSLFHSIHTKYGISGTLTTKRFVRVDLIVIVPSVLVE